MARRELPAEFAKAATGEASDVLAFVRSYGLLGYSQAWRFPFEELGAARSRIYTPNLPGDPLTWVIAHARAVKLVGELTQALDAHQDLAVLIEGLTVRGKHGADEISFLCPVRGYTRPAQVRMAPARDQRVTALRIVEHIVNPNLEGTSRHLMTERQQPVSIFAPQNLLDCVYWLLTDAIVSAKIRACENCGRFFVATNDRMKFCPVPMGLTGVSRCMNQYKQQQFRERRAMKKPGQRGKARLDRGEVRRERPRTTKKQRSDVKARRA